MYKNYTEKTMPPMPGLSTLPSPPFFSAVGSYSPNQGGRSPTDGQDRSTTELIGPEQVSHNPDPWALFYSICNEVRCCLSPYLSCSTQG